MTSTQMIRVPWLISPVWQDFPMTKGLQHHRTPIGIILAANDEIIVSLESESLDHVNVRLFNNDSKSESLFTIKNTFPDRAAVFSISAVSVPFIECQYLKNPPTESLIVKITFPSHSKPLPTFHFGDTEEDFFQLWDTQQAEFAYIESSSFALLVPEIDKEYARALPNEKHLDDLIVFYDEIFSIYSHLIGLSFEETGTNKNVKNRFFIKADKSGHGAAYYCDWCTAETSESVRNFWFDLSPTNWGALHEIGHGHELKNLNDESFSVKEVWNNILVVFYQYIMMGDDIAKIGRISSEQMQIENILSDGIPVKEWNVFKKLGFLMHMFFKVGQKSFTRFNQMIRRECSGKPREVNGNTTLEKLMHLFAREFGIDMYPFMKLTKSEISESELLEHYYTLSEVAYPLNYLISDSNQLEDVRCKINCWFNTSLVTPLDLRSTNLRNDFIITFDQNIFHILFGDVFKLMDGPRTVIERRIIYENIVIENIPIGVYKIFISPSPMNNKFIYSDFYAIVHANTVGSVTISAKCMEIPSLLEEKINFLGLGNNPFASLLINPVKQVIKINAFSTEPHSYFAGEMYASIKITNRGKEIFYIAFEGTNCPLGLYEILMQKHMQIEIFHEETDIRLKTEDPLSETIINHANKLNTFFVSKYGLRNKHSQKSLSSKRLLKRIEKAANHLKITPNLYTRPYCHPKYNLLLAIETFEYLIGERHHHINIKELYKDCLPQEFTTLSLEALVNLTRMFNKNSSNKMFYYKIIHSYSEKELIQNDISDLSINFTFLGLSDGLVATLHVDTQNEEIRFDVLSPNPHYRYEGEAYFGLTIQEKENGVVFTRTFEGLNPTKENFKIHFNYPVEIEIFHAETAHRLVSDDPVIDDMIERDRNTNTFLICKLQKPSRHKKENFFEKYHLKRKNVFQRRCKSLEVLPNY